jgi:hypothetical protein
VDNYGLYVAFSGVFHRVGVGVIPGHRTPPLAAILGPYPATFTILNSHARAAGPGRGAFRARIPPAGAFTPRKTDEQAGKGLGRPSNWAFSGGSVKGVLRA